MLTEHDMYWLTRLDYIHGFFCFFTGITSLLLAGFITCIVVALTDGDYKFAKRIGKWMKFVVSALFLAILGVIFIPTTKEMVAIKVIPKIVNRHDVRGIGSKALKLANSWLENLNPGDESMRGNAKITPRPKARPKR